jgi:hypothetical protein
MGAGGSPIGGLDVMAETGETPAELPVHVVVGLTALI